MKHVNLLYGICILLVLQMNFSTNSAQDLLPRGLSPDGPIFGMQRKGDILYLTGTFDKAGYITGGTALFSGGSDLPDLDFPYIRGNVHEIIPDGAGGWFIGGDFDRLIGFNMQNLTHILPDMSWNADFQPDPNNRVNALVLYNDILYIGGNFTGMANSSASYLAAYNTVSREMNVVSYQPNGEVLDLMVYNNHLIIAGRFSTIGGVAQRGLARINIETGDLVSFPHLTLGNVHTLLMHNEILYVGGDFSTQIVWDSFSGNRTRLFAIDMEGNAVTNWSPTISGFGQRVNALAAIDSIIYIGGAFTQVNSQTRNRLAAISVTGNLMDFNPGPNAEVFALLPENNTLWIGGNFQEISSTDIKFAANLDVETGIPSNWDMDANWAVLSFTLQNNNLLVGGEFRILRAVDRDHACAIDLNSGQVHEWDPQGGFLTGIGLLTDMFQDVVFLYGWDSQTMLNIKGFHSITGENLPEFNLLFDNAVNDIIQDPVTGNVYFGGSFQNVNGQPRARFAGIDPAGNLLPVSVDIDGEVRSLALLDSTIYIGGRYNNVNSQPRFKLAAINLAGELLPWFPEHDILIQSTSINIFAALSDKIIISGSFTQINGENRNKIAAVDPVLGNPLPWNVDANIGVLNTMKTEGDGIFISGSGLISLSGVFVNNLAYVSLYSALPVQVFPEYGFLNIFTMETWGNKLYLGGSFELLDESYYPYFSTIEFESLNFRGLIETVKPEKGGNTGDVTFEVTGTGIFPGTNISLGENGIADITAFEGSTVTFNETRMNATFDLRNQLPQFKDVIIEVPGDTTYVFENEFEIVQGKGPLPWASMIAPSFVITSKAEFIYLSYGNSGDVDAEGVPLWVAFSPNMEVVEFGFNIVNLMDPESEYYDSIPDYVLIDSLLGKPYEATLYAFIIPRIPAGSSTTIPITIKGISNGNFYTRAWTNDPFFGSPLKYVVGECMDALIGAATGFIPVVGCAYGIIDVTVSPFVDPIYDPDFGSSAYVSNYFQTVVETGIGCALDATTGGVGRVVVEVADYAIKAKNMAALGDKCFTPDDQEDQKGEFVASFDPNDKAGPAGQGAQGWLSTRRKFPYMIRFENEAEATAPAKKVIITDTLDLTVFNPESLELKSFSIGAKSFDIPNGKREYREIVDLRPQVDALVELDVSLDPV